MLDDAFEHFAREHRSRGVVRVVDQHHLGTVAERRGEGVEVRHKVGRQQRRGHVPAPESPMNRAIGVIERLEREDLVAGPHQGQQRGGDGLGGARGDDDFRLRIRSEPVETLLVQRNRLPQFQDALARGVLVGAGAIAAWAASLISAGPSSSGKPWPRLMAPVRRPRWSSPQRS